MSCLLYCCFVMRSLPESLEHPTNLKPARNATFCFNKLLSLDVKDGFMGGDHAIVTELGEKQIALGVPGPPSLDRAVSGLLAAGRSWG